MTSIANEMSHKEKKTKMTEVSVLSNYWGGTDYGRKGMKSRVLLQTCEVREPSSRLKGRYHIGSWIFESGAQRRSQGWR